jgi:hypothetical protein
LIVIPLVRNMLHDIFSIKTGDTELVRADFHCRARDQGAYMNFQGRLSMHLRRTLLPGLICGGAALAATAGQLPAPYFGIGASGTGGTGSSLIGSPGTAISTGCNPVDQQECDTASVTDTTIPSLAGFGNSTGSGPRIIANLSSFKFGASGVVEYYFEVLNSQSSTPTAVTLTFTGNLSAGYSGSGSASAVVTIGTESSSQLPELRDEVSAGAGAASYPSTLNLIDAPFTVMTNTVEVVTLDGGVNGGDSSTPGQVCVDPDTCAGTAAFSIDPVIGVSTSQPDSTDYSLIFSAGIKNVEPSGPTVPEPGTLLIMLTGLVTIGCLMRGRRSSRSMR